MIDVIIPAHEKDIETLDICIQGIRNNVKDVRRVIVVSKDKLTDSAEFYPESNFSFSLEDVGNIVGFHNRTCKYYGGSLQMTAPLVIPDLERDILTCDADTIFLNPVEFIDEHDNALYSVSYDIPSHINNHPYIEHCGKIIPGLGKQTKYSGICHHTLIQKDILQEIFDKVESRHGHPFWKSNLIPHC
jgi:glycosyltransferase involved in cell wall biosynthesis